MEFVFASLAIMTGVGGALTWYLNHLRRRRRVDTDDDS